MSKHQDFRDFVLNHEFDQFAKIEDGRAAFHLWRDEYEALQAAVAATEGPEKNNIGRPTIYMCPAGCGCLWKDNLNGTMSLYGSNSQSCDVCEWLPLGDLTPLCTRPSASVPEMTSEIINDCGWAFIEAMPHNLPGPIWNDLKPALYAAIKEYHEKVITTTPQPADDSLQEIANKVCGHAPEGWIISFCMENGAAWVEASRPDGEAAELPDSADQTLVEQINDALCVAKGWINPAAEGAER